jgi:hypothetical protein
MIFKTYTYNDALKQLTYYESLNPYTLSASSDFLQERLESMDNNNLVELSDAIIEEILARELSLSNCKTRISKKEVTATAGSEADDMIDQRIQDYADRLKKLKDPSS